MKLPNNKQLATVHLKHLKRNLEKNPEFKEDYVKVKAGVFEDGDVAEANETPKEGNTWYIPHHGVYPPKEPKEYCKRVNIFGPASSPVCANYGMKHLTSEHGKENPLAASLIRKTFYVDDGLISVGSVDKVKQLGQRTTRSHVCTTH